MNNVTILVFRVFLDKTNYDVCVMKIWDVLVLFRYVLCMGHFDWLFRLKFYV